MNIGVYCDTLTDEIFEFVNDLKDDGHNPLVFTNNWNTINQNDICVMNSVQIWSFNDPIIAMDHVAGRFLIECPTPVKRAILIREYAWSMFSFEDSLRVYDDDNISLVVTNEHDSDVVKGLFHSNVCLAPGLDPSKICELFEEEVVDEC